MKPPMNLAAANHSAIVAIGTATPPYKQQQGAILAAIASGLHLKTSEKRLLKSVYNATGIAQRYSVLSDYIKSPGEFTFFPNHPADPLPTTAARMKIYQDNALKLALAAIQNCLVPLADFKLSDITHLITVSCTGMYAPGIDIELVQSLPLNSTTKRTAVNFMGCFGAFNALKVADAFCTATANATVLIVCVELCSIHLQQSMHLDNMIANAIFADGAAALLVTSNPSPKKYITIENFHNDLLPQTHQAMTWQIGDQGFDIVLSSYVPAIIQAGIAAFVQTLYKLSPNDHPIDFYAIHPGGIKILQACEEALTINKHHNKYAYDILRNYGNMSSATVVFVLKAIWDDIKQLDHQKTIFSCAFGPGLSLESMLLKIYNVK